MKLEYHTVESTVKPETVESIGDIVYIRKDLSQITHEYGDDVKYWSYKEAIMRRDEFDLYSKLFSIDNAKMPEHISEIIDTQKLDNDNQLTLMNAIADLYELLEELLT